MSLRRDALLQQEASCLCSPPPPRTSSGPRALIEAIEPRRLLSASFAAEAEFTTPYDGEPMVLTEPPAPKADGGTRYDPDGDGTPFSSDDAPYFDNYGNCHGFAFHGGRGDPTDPENPRKRDGDLLFPKADLHVEDDIPNMQKVPEGQAEPGDVITYKKPGGRITHSGIVTKVEDGVITEIESIEGLGAHRAKRHPLDPDLLDEYGGIEGVYRHPPGQQPPATQPGGPTTNPSDGGDDDEDDDDPGFGSGGGGGVNHLD